MLSWTQYKDTGQHKEAVLAYEAAIALKKEHISAWNNYGLLYDELGKLSSLTILVLIT